jgi:hypothetical protein
MPNLGFDVVYAGEAGTIGTSEDKIVGLAKLEDEL